jgi:type 1 glutamine amidotransferase
MARATITSWALGLAANLVVGGCGRPPATDGPAPGPTGAPARVLVLTKTAGFRHASIPDGVAALRALSREHGFAVESTADAGRISDTSLSSYKAVVFLSTTGDVLDQTQQDALRRWVLGGGGWVGIHAAADAEQGWPWYGELLGTRFRGHPPIQRAVVTPEPGAWELAGPLPARWVRSDEWYNFQPDPRPHVRVLATVDEGSYRGGTMGTDHPVAWCHGVGRGRSWYTAGGHTVESYAEPAFRAHLLAGVRYATGATAARCTAR